MVDTFPADSHEPIVYPAALTGLSTNPEAKAYLEYLHAVAGRRQGLRGRRLALVLK